MAKDNDHHDRRKYPRLKRPVFYRLPSFFDRWKSVHDVGLGGCRIFTDERLKKGKNLVLEVLLPDETTLQARATVVWVNELPEGSPAAWELGIQFYNLPPGAHEILKSYLEAEPG